MKSSARILSLLLAVLLCLPLVSTGALAGSGPEDVSGQPPTGPAEGGPAAETVLSDPEPETEAPVPDEGTETAPDDGAETVSDEDEEPGELSGGPAFGEEPEQTEAFTSQPDIGSDALFAAYAETQLYGAPVSDSLPALDGVSAGEKLTGKDAKAYAILKPFFEKLAAGSIREASLVITPEDLGVPTTWTAEELGVDSLNASTLKAAYTTFSQAFSFDVQSVVNALISDLPYDLYWYDKTTGYATSKKSSYTYYPAFATYSSTLTLYFAVSKNYTAGSYTTYTLNGTVYPLTLNSCIPKRVTDAAAMAKYIVSSYASKSDYEKLKGYKEAICYLASYNTPAYSNKSTPYGDPWQLIYALDGDTSTAVVCEGYAKAFQYLCDLTTFRSRLISCYSVTGYMSGGTGAGNHMWNIVHMDDGKNYLVDVTNCDTGTIGAPEYLFLKGYSSRMSSAFGFTFRCGSKNISFTYDSDTISMFTTDELTISGLDYDPAGAAPVPVAGDMNGDGIADAFDAALILKAWAGIAGSSNYTAADAALLLKTSKTR